MQPQAEVRSKLPAQSAALLISSSRFAKSAWNHACLESCLQLENQADNTESPPLSQQTAEETNEDSGSMLCGDSEKYP